MCVCSFVAIVSFFYQVCRFFLHGVSILSLLSIVSIMFECPVYFICRVWFALMLCRVVSVVVCFLCRIFMYLYHFIDPTAIMTTKNTRNSGAVSFPFRGGETHETNFGLHGYTYNRHVAIAKGSGIFLLCDPNTYVLIPLQKKNVYSLFHFP